ICGGGRYDNLLAALGGADLPALGFGMGDVVLGELLRARGLMRATEGGVDYWVAGEGEGSEIDVVRVAAALRARGRSVEYALRAQKVDKQRRAAQSAGARAFVVLRAAGGKGDVMVRSLEDGTERTVRLEEWLAGA
ncbi:MAG TPA: His/Gly/Thr/Pro-type tRNA ligase C-terminal domain-containing protein, partial [Gemmatimonadaceae bacterium]